MERKEWRASAPWLVRLRYFVGAFAIHGTNNALQFPASFVTVLDTVAGQWCDRNGVVTTARTGRYSADAPGGEASNELTRRCRHAAAAVGEMLFVYGGLRGGELCRLLLRYLRLEVVSEQCAVRVWMPERR